MITILFIIVFSNAVILNGIFIIPIVSTRIVAKILIAYTPPIPSKKKLEEEEKTPKHHSHTQNKTKCKSTKTVQSKLTTEYQTKIHTSVNYSPIIISFL